MIMTDKLTKHQYLDIRPGAKERGADLYSSHHKIKEAKKRCYPENITVTEQVREIQLQSLLDNLMKLDICIVIIVSERRGGSL